MASVPPVATVDDHKLKQAQRDATNAKKHRKWLAIALVIVVVVLVVWIRIWQLARSYANETLKAAYSRVVLDSARISALIDSLERERNISANRQAEIDSTKAENGCLLALAAFGNQDDKIHPTSRIRLRVRKPYSPPIKPVPTAVDRLAFAATADSCPARLEKLVAKNRDARALLEKAKTDSSRFKQEPPHK